MIIARSFDVAVNVIILVFLKWLNDIPLYIYSISSLTIPLLMDIQVVSVLAFVNSATMNIRLHISFFN